MKKVLLLGALTALLSFGFTGCDNSSDDSDDTVYALVNIPFAQFFEAETSDGSFDAYSSATQKACNGSMSYGTYHEPVESASDAVTRGITCAVKISRAALETLGGNEITDDSASVDLSVSGRGGTTTTRYSGKQILFNSPDYSYYILNEKPSYYKEVEVNGSNVKLSKIKCNEKDLGTLYVEEKAGEAHHYFSPAITFYMAAENNQAEEGSLTVVKFAFSNGDTAKKVTIDSETNEEVLTDQALSALKTIIATDTDGNSYGLTTLENFFWGKSQMGFQAPEDTDENKNLYPQHALVGKTIKKLTFITEDEIYVTSDIKLGTTVTDSETKIVTFTPDSDSSFVIKNLQAE